MTQLTKHLFLIKLAAVEGERCGGRGGPWCLEGLLCVGKTQEVDGQGTCRNSSKLQTFIINFLLNRESLSIQKLKLI